VWNARKPAAQQVEMQPEDVRRQGAQSTIEKVQAYSSREVYGKMALSPSKLFERLLIGLVSNA
jgi:hypothetical protein